MARVFRHDFPPWVGRGHPGSEQLEQVVGETDEPLLLPDGIDPPKAHLAAPGPFDLPEHRLRHHRRR